MVEGILGSLPIPTPMWETRFLVPLGCARSLLTGKANMCQTGDSGPGEQSLALLLLSEVFSSGTIAPPGGLRLRDLLVQFPRYNLAWEEIIIRLSGA